MSSAADEGPETATIQGKQYSWVMSARRCFLIQINYLVFERKLPIYYALVPGQFSFKHEFPFKHYL
ncbi:MAG: hypothetical protein GY941_13500 [Planctomycetes bacterium]|nr:hypothetical protein [Planctomycetota bacterium]